MQLEGTLLFPIRLAVCLVSVVIFFTIMLTFLFRENEEALFWHCRWFSKVLLFCLGVRLKVSGDPSELLARRCLWVGNHVSYVDIVALLSIFPTAFLAKSEVRGWSLFRLFPKDGLMEFVNRQCLGSRAVAIRRISRRLERQSICVFPEGTTTDQPAPFRWHAGQMHAAKATEAQVIAFGLAYMDQSAQAWLGDDALIPHLVRQMLAPSRTVALTFLPLSPELVKNLSARQLSSHVLSIVKRLCQESRYQLGGHPDEKSRPFFESASGAIGASS